MNLVISKCVTAFKVSNFTCHYLGNSSTLDIGVLGYIGTLYSLIAEYNTVLWDVLLCILFKKSTAAFRMGLLRQSLGYS